MSKCPVNVIIGCDSGKFRVSVKFTKNGERKSREKKFPADNPKEIWKYLKQVNAEMGIDNVMYSSSMDFPEEDGVTRKQVQAFENYAK